MGTKHVFEDLLLFVIHRLTELGFLGPAHTVERQNGSLLSSWSRQCPFPSLSINLHSCTALNTYRNKLFFLRSWSFTISVGLRWPLISRRIWHSPVLLLDVTWLCGRVFPFDVYVKQLWFSGWECTHVVLLKGIFKMRGAVQGKLTVVQRICKFSIF